MNLDRVTITGADDSIYAQALADISGDFPFVEWGILVSESQTGKPRFPSDVWMKELADLAHAHTMQLSLHVCGRWVRRLLLGDCEIPVELRTPLFQRVQLNFHAERTQCNPQGLADRLNEFGPRQFIFQIDGAYGNAHLGRLLVEAGGVIDAVPLFDISGGAGILPAEWPKPIHDRPDAYHGYAGGLGPDNLAEQIQLIGEAAGDARIWIDMETRVRSEDDRQFDLDKVVRCLEIAAPYITKVAAG